MTLGKFIWGLRIRTLPVAEPLNHVLQTALAVVKVLFWFAILSSYHPIATAHKWALDPAGDIPNSPDCIPGARDHAIRGGQREEEPLPAQMSLCGFRLDLSCFILKPFSSQLEGGDSVALSSMVWTEDTGLYQHVGKTFILCANREEPSIQVSLQSGKRRKGGLVGKGEERHNFWEVC